MSAVASPDRMVRVIVASDRPLILEGMSRAVLQRVTFQLVAELGEGLATVESIMRLRPDVAVLDPTMHGLDAARLLNTIGRDGLPTRIVLVAGDTHASAYDALAVGALGYLSRRATGADIGDAIVRAARGVATIDPLLHTDVATQIRIRERPRRPALSPRELEVLKLAADGVSAPGKAAAYLGIATTTVRKHWEHIFEKLDVSDRAAAVAVAMRLGLLD